VLAPGDGIPVFVPLAEDLDLKVGQERANLSFGQERRIGVTGPGPSPVDRGRGGSKHHLLVDGGGIPLAWTITGGNRNDVTQLLELLDRVPMFAAASAGRAAGRGR
jgi:hypothetical protein